MTDRGLMSRFTAKSKTQTEEEEHDEAVAKALRGTRQLREELDHWRERAEKAEAGFNQHKYELGAKLAHARETVDSLRKELDDTREKRDFYQNQMLELTIKTGDIETFFIQELARISDAANQSANTMISMANGSARTMRKFIDDLAEKRKTAEFKPKEGPRPVLPPLSADEEVRMKELATRLAPKTESPNAVQSEESPGPLHHNQVRQGP